MMKKFYWIILFLLFDVAISHAEDGYRLWLRYNQIENASTLQQYRNTISGIQVSGNSPTLTIVKNELTAGLEGLLGRKVTNNATDKYVLAATAQTSPIIQSQITNQDLSALGGEGFIIRSVTTSGKNGIIITGNTDKAILYGAFHLLRLMQTGQPIQKLAITSVPKIQLRMLNHWDNLNRTVERGYSGISIWDWHKLPDYIDQRYIDYARANASIGINATVLTNVNANAQILTNTYLQKIKALADVFRPYGIKVYLTARFSAPIELGRLKTADPLDPQVREWWKKKIDSIYTFIPDFGGFLVKANSEGQPGPQDYKRNHADGANMLAEALEPHNGIVMWRAFVYSNETPVDRIKQAYDEFKPLDGKFRKNVLVQVKNGPLDFQPREPFHPLFGAMPQTPLMMEFQITQEYLGQATNLVYEAPLFKEVLDADTYAKGPGSTVAKVLDGSLENHSLSGMAGVSNVGNDRNWTGHPFGQANWYTLGRLAWDPGLTSEQIADEWIRQTFTSNPKFIEPVKKLMLASREIMVNYMTPMGLTHIMGTSHHYGPAPWVSNAGRADWNPVYYHKADSVAIGFNRSTTGSNALEQYMPQVRKQWEDVNTISDKYLLWFHRVPWTHKLKSGRTVWNELVHKYNTGVDSVRWMQQTWNTVNGLIDQERFNQVKMLLAVQEKEAVWWRDACLAYFQSMSKLPIPANYEKPAYSLDYYKSLRFPFAPGIGGNN